MVAPWSISQRSPCQTSMLGLRHDAVDVVDQRVEPDDPPRLGRAHLVGERVEAERARQVVHAEVQSAARLEQLLHLLVRLGETDDRIELDGDQFRHPQPQPPPQLTADDLRDERLAALAGSGELHDVRTEIVGLDNPGERSTLPQGRDIAGRYDLQRSRPGPVRHRLQRAPANRQLLGDPDFALRGAREHPRPGQDVPPRGPGALQYARELRGRDTRRTDLLRRNHSRPPIPQVWDCNLSLHSCRSPPRPPWHFRDVVR
ncbi:hypothetical protein SMICM17S_06193 [Streptomyces microflavus]